jgi:hypothetical protein
MITVTAQQRPGPKRRTPVSGRLTRIRSCTPRLDPRTCPCTCAGKCAAWHGGMARWDSAEGGMGLPPTCRAAVSQRLSAALALRDSLIAALALQDSLIAVLALQDSLIAALALHDWLSALIALRNSFSGAHCALQPICSARAPKLAERITCAPAERVPRTQRPVE